MCVGTPELGTRGTNVPDNLHVLSYTRTETILPQWVYTQHTNYNLSLLMYSQDDQDAWSQLVRIGVTHPDN